MNHNVIKNHNGDGSVQRISRLLRGLALMPLLCLLLAAPAALANTGEEAGDAAHAGEAAVVNINSADAETLAGALQGIGQSKAEAIVEWREANGAFTSLDQLTEVKGVGQATVDKNRHKLSL